MSKADELPKYGNYIDGAVVPPASNAYLPTENPYTGKVWALIGRGDENDVAAAADGGRARAEPGRVAADDGHATRPPAVAAGRLIIANAERLAAVEQRDNGKIVSEAAAQIRYMGDYFKYYAGLADKVQGAVIPTDKRGVFTYTRYEPKGVVAIITPWNSPLTLTSWKLAPALAAGCTAVIKPSEFTSASMLEFAPLFAEAGFPKGVVNVITGLGTRSGRGARRASGDCACRVHRRRRRRPQDLPACCRRLKTVTLELGGKSPNIVFDDADLEQAVKGVVSGIFAASGQSCQAGSRLLLQRSIHDRFVEKLVAFVRSAKMGDPALPTRRSARSRRGRNSRRFSTTSGSPRRKARAAFSAETAAPISAPGCSSSPRSSPA